MRLPLSSTIMDVSVSAIALSAVFAFVLKNEELKKTTESLSNAQSQIEDLERTLMAYSAETRIGELIQRSADNGNDVKVLCNADMESSAFYLTYVSVSGYDVFDNDFSGFEQVEKFMDAGYLIVGSSNLDYGAMVYPVPHGDRVGVVAVNSLFDYKYWPVLGEWLDAGMDTDGQALLLKYQGAEVEEYFAEFEPDKAGYRVTPVGGARDGWPVEPVQIKDTLDPCG